MLFDKEENSKKPFGMSDLDFNKFKNLLKEDIISSSKDNNMPLFYTENGIKVKQMPDGTKYEIKHTGNGNHEIVRQLN